MQGLSDSEREELAGYLSPETAKSARLDAWTRMAMFRASRAVFGKAYVYALSLLVSHRAALESRGSDGAAGPVSSVREGDLSVSYGSSGNAGDGDLSSTSYGQEYLSLLRQYRPKPGLTGGTRICGGCGGDIVQSLF